MWKMGGLHSAVAAAWACATSTLSAQAPRLDACAVLTREEIKTLSGGHDPGPVEQGANWAPGQATTCFWDRTSPKTSVSLFSNVDPDEPKGLALKQLLDHGRKARAVSGLGDDAFFEENSKDEPGGTLFVRVGHWRLKVYRDADTPVATSESVLPTLTAFAKAAIPKLRKAG